MIRVLHLVGNLVADGDEGVMLQLISNMTSAYFRHSVVPLTGSGVLDPGILEFGARMRTPEMSKTPTGGAVVAQLARWIREAKPDVVQTWTYHAHLIGGLSARLAGCGSVFWSVRHGRPDHNTGNRSAIQLAHACADFSGAIPRHVICCSQASLRAHLEMGYAGEHMLVIPDGFDLEQFKPSPDVRASLRTEFGLTEADVVIGLVAGFHPAEDHQTFIAAAARLFRENPHLSFVLCEGGVDWDSSGLERQIGDAGIGSACRLLGRRADMMQVYSCLDIVVTSSSGYGFPRVVGEAMACGVPAVVMDEGDSALMGDTSKAIPPANPEALARACLGLIEIGPAGRSLVGALARRRVEQRFSLTAMVQRYQALYASAATGEQVNSLRSRHAGAT